MLHEICSPTFADVLGRFASADREIKKNPIEICRIFPLDAFPTTPQCVSSSCRIFLCGISLCSKKQTRKFPDHYSVPIGVQILRRVNYAARKHTVKPVLFISPVSPSHPIFRFVLSSRWDVSLRREKLLAPSWKIGNCGETNRRSFPSLFHLFGKIWIYTNFNTPCHTNYFPENVPALTIQFYSKSVCTC